MFWQVGKSECQEPTTFCRRYGKDQAALEEAVRVGAKHRVTIPSRISKALRLKKGDPILMRLVGGHVEIVPVSLIPKEQLCGSGLASGSGKSERQRKRWGVGT
jgi:AbrB family looped-hinge helix DNA binding protein